MNWAARKAPRRVNEILGVTRSMRGPHAEELVRAAARVEGAAIRQGSLGEALAPSLSILSPAAISALCASASATALPTIGEGPAAEEQGPLRLEVSEGELALRTHASRRRWERDHPRDDGVGALPGVTEVEESQGWGDGDDSGHATEEEYKV